MVVVEGDYLVLLDNRTRVHFEPIVEPLYHNLKAVCHIPLAIFTLLSPYVLDQNRSIPFPRTSLLDLQSKYAS